MKLLSSGMVAPVGFPEVFGTDEGVNLRGRDIRMAQHDLNGTQIGPSFKKMGGEGVAQGVGRNRFGNTGLSGIAADDLPESLAGQGPAPTVQENPVGASAFKQGFPSLFQIDSETRSGLRTNGDQPFLGTLAEGPDQVRLQLQVLQGQGNDFRNPQSGGIEDLQHGLVPEAPGAIAFRLIEKLFHFKAGKGFGQTALGPGTLQRQRRVVPANPLFLQETMKSPQGRKDPGLRTGREPPGPQGPQKIIEGIRLGLLNIPNPFTFQESEIIDQVPAIGLQGVLGQAPFD